MLVDENAVFLRIRIQRQNTRRTSELSYRERLTKRWRHNKNLKASEASTSAVLANEARRSYARVCHEVHPSRIININEYLE